MPPSTTTSRRTTTRQPSSTSRKKTTVEQLAEQLATNLVVSKDVKGKQKAAPSMTPEEQRSQSMKNINSASQYLSSLFQSGWRHSQEKSTQRTSVTNDAITSASKAAINLQTLRKLGCRDVDIERAAMSVLGKLVALELYEPALQIVRDSYGRICDIAGSSLDKPSASERQFSALLSIPIPANVPTDTTTLTLISSYLFNAIATLSYHTTTPQRLKQDALTLDTFTGTLLNKPTLLQWMPHFSTLPAKHVDPILTKTYSLLTKMVPSGVKHNPLLVFQIRMYSLNCLAHTSSGIVESPASLWNQASKYAMSYAKGVGNDGSGVETPVSAAFTELVRIAETRPDRASFVSGEGFMNFCETWTAFANRSGDLQSLDRIGFLLQNASMPSSPSKLAPSPMLESKGENVHDQNSLLIDGTRLYNMLAHLVTILDKNVTDEAVPRIEECSTFIQSSSLAEIVAYSGETDKELQRVSGKVQRALEKSRRSALKLLEKPEDLSNHCNDALRKFLVVVVQTLENALRLNPHPDFFTQILDASFTLARTTLTISDPRTYTTAYDHLDRAVAILDGALKGQQPPELATYLRCTSGAFHNLAGTLYQAGRYGSAIPYLKESCRLGDLAVDTRSQGKTEGDDVWKQLEEQLWRRWQLLALCYTKIGDRRAAFGSLQRCVEAFPYERSTFIQYTNKNGLSSLFDLNPSVKDLVGVVDRLTQMGTCELLFSARDVSLRHIKVSHHCVRGALIERQLDGLVTYRHKEGIAMVISVLLKDAVDTYQAGSMPLRSIRVHVKALAFAYHNGIEHISSLGSIDDIAAKITNSVDSEDLGNDKELARFLAEYKASAQLWLGLYAHRTANPRKVLLITNYAEEACKTLHAWVSPSTQTATTTPPSKPSKAAGRQPKTLKSRTNPPKTPNPRSRAALKDLSANTPPQPTNGIQQSSSQTLDSPQNLVEVLQLSAHVLGILSLNVLKIKILDIMRRIAEQFVGMTSDAFIMASSDLGYEYLLLGKYKRARKIFDLTHTSVHNGGGSEHASGKFLLRYAELCALDDNVSQSIELYGKAQTLASHVIEEKQSSSYHKMQSKIVRLELAAMASSLLAVVSSVKNDHSTSLKSLLNALRLWNRAYESLARLQPPPSSAAKAIDDSNPFDISNSKASLPVVTPQTLEQPKKVYTRRTSMSGLEWRICQGLLQTMFALSQTYLMRGSSREAQYFAEQARDLAESLNAPAFVCRAVTRLEELRMQHGQLEELDNLEQLDLAAGLGIDVADVHRLRGDFEQRVARIEDAQSHYESALRVLEEFDQAFGKLDGVEFGPRQSIGSSHGTDVLTPSLLIRVLREHIWVLRDESGEQFEELLNRFLAIPPTLQSQTEKDALMAKLTLHEVYSRSRVDMFLSSIGESTVALPMGTSNDLSVSVTPAFQEILRSLETAEKLFWSQLSAHGRSGHVPDIRAALTSIALIGTFQASMGRSELSRSGLMAGLLDASAAITLRREMLEVIQNKYPSNLDDDLVWPSISADGSLVYSAPKRRKVTLDVSDNEDDESPDDVDDGSLRKYWESVRDRYQSSAMDPETLSSPAAAHLPPHWTVVHMTVTEDKNTLFISRQRGGANSKDRPLLFCIPLKGRRENPGEDEEQQLTFEDAVEEFNEIVRLSNETTKVAVTIRADQAARASWWKERGALDTRLRELLENIEFCWLGAFKTIMNKNTHLSPEGIAALRIQFDRVFQEGLRLQDKKTKEKALGHGKVPSEGWGPNRVTLDDALVECFSTLSPRCKDEELEDLVYFILDLYQFHGVQVAIAEIDIDQIVVDLRGVLEEHAARMKPKSSNQSGPSRVGAFGHSRATQSSNEDEHLFLVLDKNLQGLPWESIPILRGRSVSRIPCMSFLTDRLEFACWRREQAGSSTSPMVDRAIVDPRKGYYIMNPSGDLTRTQERFQPWLKEMESLGWQGIAGRQPSELEVLRALEQNDLVVYFGHGGAEQYVRSHKIRHLQRCAAVMLWGCSSGFLRDMGDFDRVGTPLNYMLAGCPALVANLWDVTDKDIDAFSQGVFDKLHMNANNLRKLNQGSGTGVLDNGGKGTSLMTAVAQSRDVCKLKYLTGAAPVVYGIPFYL